MSDLSQDIKPERPSLKIDVALYEQMLADSDMTEAQKQE